MKTLNTEIQCVPCVIRQVTSALEDKHIGKEDVWKTVRELLKEYISGGLDDETSLIRKSPVFMCALGFEKIASMFDEDDYYQETKKKWNAAAMELLPELEVLVRESEHPLKTAVKISIIGNLIDFGVGTVVREAEKKNLGMHAEGLKHIVYSFLEQGAFDVRGWDQFESRVRNARRIMFIADNAGEFVLDKILIDQLGPEKTTCILRENPVINDMTMKDLETTGVDFLGCKILSDGSRKRIPAFSFEFCSREALSIFEDADVVICKGMGNFESLFGRSGEKTFFLVVTKCDVLSSILETQKNTLVLTGNETV